MVIEHFLFFNERQVRIGTLKQFLHVLREANNDIATVFLLKILNRGMNHAMVSPMVVTGMWTMTVRPFRLNRCIRRVSCVEASEIFNRKRR